MDRNSKEYLAVRVKSLRTAAVNLVEKTEAIAPELKPEMVDISNSIEDFFELLSRQSEVQPSPALQQEA